MKLYVVSVDEYDENYALAIFDTIDKATEFMDSNNERRDLDCREYILNDTTSICPIISSKRKEHL